MYPANGLLVLFVRAMHTCHFNSFSVGALKGAIYLSLAEVTRLSVDADALGDGVAGVLQPLPFCLLLSVHHPSHHLHP